MLVQHVALTCSERGWGSLAKYLLTLELEESRGASSLAPPTLVGGKLTLSFCTKRAVEAWEEPLDGPVWLKVVSASVGFSDITMKLVLSEEKSIGLINHSRIPECIDFATKRSSSSRSVLWPGKSPSWQSGARLPAHHTKPHKYGIEQLHPYYIAGCQIKRCMIVTWYGI